MALTGPLKIKTITLPNAFVQVASFNVVPGFEIIGQVNIFVDAEQAKNIENAIDKIIVVTIDDLVTDYRQQLYNELIQDNRFKDLADTPDIHNIVTALMERGYLRQPIGHFDSESNTATRFM